MSEWYVVSNIDEIDSPGLLIYPERAQHNIDILKSFVNDVTRLRPHVKTNKSPDIAKMHLAAGINKFKCATIAEAEMLAGVHAADVLVAHQPVGPKGKRLADLIKKFPGTTFSCIVDDKANAVALSKTFEHAGLVVPVYIDINVGMNRSGILPGNAMELIQHCSSLKGIKVIGLHAYDGHLREPDLAVRTKQCDEGFAPVIALRDQAGKAWGMKMSVVAGGTPSFPIHAKRADVECSPGTYIYWDKGYQQILKEQPFEFAALVITRVISTPDENTICADLGHKAIASENPLASRVHFLNAPELTPVGHSEEHLVLKTDGKKQYKVGDVLYGVPHHVCPTVALHDSANVVKNGRFTGTWETVSRKRKISV